MPYSVFAFSLLSSSNEHDRVCDALRDTRVNTIVSLTEVINTQQVWEFWERNETQIKGVEPVREMTVCVCGVQNELRKANAFGSRILLRPEISAALC